MNKQDLKSKIEKLEKGIASKVTPENLKASLKTQKEKFEKELADLEKKEKKDKAAVSDKIKSLKDKVKSKISSISRDGARKAKAAGKRVAADGSIYYEKRANRTDSQTKKKPYLEEGGKLDKDISDKIDQDLKLIATKKEKYQKELNELRAQKSQDRDTITYLEYELESLDKLHDRLSKVKTQKMAKGGDLYDDMDEDIEFANKKALALANSLKGLGFNVLKVEEADYDTDANISLSDNVNVNVHLEGEIAIVIDKGDGKFLFIDCGKSYATLLQKLKKLEEDGTLEKRNNMNGIKLTLSDKDSYDYTYTQDGTKNSITFAFGQGEFQFEVKKISKPLEKYKQDILDAFVIQGVKQHDYKGGFSEAIKHLDTSVVNQQFAKGGKVDNTYIPNKDVKELMVVLKNKLVKLKGDDILDGVYAKNSALKGAKKYSKNVSAEELYTQLLDKAQELKEEDVTSMKKEDIQTLLDAGYDAKDIEIIYFGIRVLNPSIDMSYDESGLLGYSDEIIPRNIEQLVKAAKNNAYEIGLKYPEFNWKNIIKKYNISKDGKDINGEELKWGNDTTEYTVYTIFEGNKVVLGTSTNKVEYKNGKKQPERDYYKKDPQELADFTGGYWGLVTSSKEIMYDIANMILSQKSGYVKDINLFVNHLGGVDAKDLDKNDIKYEKGGSLSNEEYDKLTREYDKLAALAEDAVGEEKEEYKRELEKVAQKIHREERGYAKGGTVKYYDKETEYRIGRPTNYIEKEVLSKVNHDEELFVGAFGWTTSGGKTAEGYLYNLNDFDQKLVSDVKLKQGEKIFRYFNRTTAIGGITPLIKINVDKALLYFPINNENEVIDFETRGVNANYIALIAHKMAKGGGIYSSDSLYYLQVLKDGEEVGREKFRAKNLKDATEIAQDDYEDKYKSKHGDHLSFIVSEAMPNTNHMAEGGEVNTRELNKNIRNWYIKTYPTDDLGEEINEKITFKSFWAYLSQGYDAYEVLGVSDSVVRERVFEKLSDILGVDYDVVYQKWLASDKMAKGGETNKNISVFGYDTLNFDICPLAIEEFEKAVVALEGSSDSTKLALSRAAMYLDDVFGVEKQAKADNSVSKNEFEYAVNQSLVATSYNYAAGLEVNLFKIIPMHISQIASKLVYITKNENRDDLTAYDLLVVREKLGESAFKNMTPEERRNAARDYKNSYEEGGTIEDSNYRMVISQTKAVKHHANELLDSLTPDTKVEAWVVGKIERASTDLADVAHYIDGLKPEGTFEQGGETNGYSSARLLGRESQDWEAQGREYAGAEWDKLTQSEKDEIISDLQRSWDKNTNFEQGGYMAKGGELANGAYYLGKPKKQGIIWSQTVVDIDNDSIEFAKDYARKIKDFNATGKKKLSNEEFAKFLKEDKRGENLSPKYEDWENYAAGGMIVGRWYKDNQGVEHRYIGEDATGQPLFSNGEKVSVKSLDDFEPSTKESKLFKWFNEGGEIKDEFLEDMAELHKEIAEITLVDGSKISGEELRQAHHKMAKGGETKFEDKVKAIKASLLKKKKVSPKVQKDYGKTYNAKEAEQAAKRIAGAMRKKGMK